MTRVVVIGAGDGSRGGVLKMAKTYDVVIVGAGSGGLAAAHAAKFMDASVCIVQDGPIGGDCTFTGCVPSKALLAASARGEDFATAMATVKAAVEEVAAAESADVQRAHGFNVVEGRGVLRGGGKVDVGGVMVTARSVIVAPGSRPGVPPIPGLAEVEYLTNEEIWELRKLPASMLIVGGGPIGCEMAQAFATFGSDVTLVEGEQRILPRDDADASHVIHEELTRLGVNIVVGAFVQKVSSTGAGILLDLDSSGSASQVTGEVVMVATGRRPAHQGMGLDDVGVEMTASGWIHVDETMKTTAKRVWAIGDAVGSTQFTHSAAHMARLAVHNANARGMARLKKLKFHARDIPWVTFVTPEVAQVGVTEAEACSIKGARVAELPLDAVDRAVATRQTAGFIKLIARPRRILGWAGGGRLIGATIVAPTAGELIGEVALAIRTGMFAGRLAQTVHPYPSWSFGLQTAAVQFMGTIDGRTARPPRPERSASL